MHEEYRTASSGNEEEIVIQGPTRRVHVSDKIIKQAPKVEKYMAEESYTEIRHKEKRKVQREVVQYVSETESDSADEVFEVKRPVEKVRHIPQADIIQRIIEEQPQQKIIKHAIERISVPVQRIVQDRISETVNIETEYDRRLKVTLRQDIDTKISLRARLTRELDMCISDISRMEAEYNILMNKKTTEVREKLVDRTVTDYVEKKMRKTTTETPIPVKNWVDKAY